MYNTAQVIKLVLSDSATCTITITIDNHYMHVC